MRQMQPQAEAEEAALPFIDRLEEAVLDIHPDLWLAGLLLTLLIKWLV